jgi:putative CocE/NonD family hydrolase
MIEDQRFASTRPDVLVYETAPLEEDITVAGPILAELFAATTGTDSDWIVKVIDVFPGDSPDTAWCETPMGSFQMLLSGEIFRAKFRNSFANPEPVVPDEVTAYQIDLHDRFHTFKRGHKIMVQIQSTWFPVYDRNPHRFVDIYHAQPDDFQKATQTIQRSRQYPSAIEFRVLPK